jgi:anaerobic dimethyl sulfoxide reductase subunit B
MAKQLGFYMNLAACTGCKACMIACKDKNDLPIGVNWRRVYEYEGGEWVKHSNGMYVANNVFTYFVSVACGHCQDARCVDICPSKAMVKGENGVVTIDETKCIGCRYCEWVCPYDAPQFNEATGLMTKCDFCEDLLALGQKPACVDACPYRAMDFGDLDELKAKYGTLDNPAPLPEGTYTFPSMVFGPNKTMQTASGATGTVGNLEEG